MTTKRTDHRKETKGLTASLLLTERGKKATSFTGGRKGSKTLGQAYEDRTSFLSSEIQIANGDYFHGIVDISPDESGEHGGTLVMFPVETDCWVCREAKKRVPESTPKKSYAFSKGMGKYSVRDKATVELRKIKLSPCPHCVGTGKEHLARVVDLHHEFDEFAKLTGLTREDVFPYRYHYFSHEAIQNKIGFSDYHVDEDTGWSVAGDDEKWVAHVEKYRKLQRTKSQIIKAHAEENGIPVIDLGLSK